MLETDLSIDYLLIQVAKHLVANYITCHGDQDFMGMSLQDAILSIYSNFRYSILSQLLIPILYSNINIIKYSSLEEYLDTYILKMDVSAEGPFVDLGLLLKALRCKGVSIFLDRRAEVPISILETNYEEEDTIGSPSIPIADIHM